MHNPLKSLRRRTYALWIVAIPVIVLAGYWALRPLEAIDLPVWQPKEPLKSIERQPEQSFPSLDLAVFETRIWNPAPPPETPVLAIQEPPQPQPQPPSLKLLAVAQEFNEAGVQTLLACFYDERQDEIVFLAAGDIAAPGWRVAQVDQYGVQLSGPRGPIRFALRDEQ